MRQSRTPSLEGVQQAMCVTVQGVGLQKQAPESHYWCIDDTMAQDDELTASSLKDILNKSIGNKEKCVSWCTRCIDKKELLTSPLSNWRVTKVSAFERRRCQGSLNINSTTPKIHVWDGILKRGATHLVMFSGMMNATKYKDILSASLLPFVRNTYPDGHRLYQDNDPKHTSEFLQNFHADRHQLVEESSQKHRPEPY